jgi:hypothetical protein
MTGQALRQAVERRDGAALMGLVRQLRVLGCDVSPEELAQQLLRQGCTRVRDSLGGEVPLHVRVPPLPVHPSAVADTSFRLAL